MRTPHYLSKFIEIYRERVSTTSAIQALILKKGHLAPRNVLSRYAHDVSLATPANGEAIQHDRGIIDLQNNQQKDEK